MSPKSNAALSDAVRPQTEAVVTQAKTDPAKALAALRLELDTLDADLLGLIERRQGMTRRIGALKDAAGGGLKLRPDREAEVVRKVLERAAPENRRFALALWREVMSAGLSSQGQVEVAVWSGARRDAAVLARTRFGGSADYRDVSSHAEALAAADADGVAVLALDPDVSWWEDLPERTDLWVFDALGRRGPADPAVLVVGRLAPSVLARGVSYRVSSGGDSGWERRPERLISAGRGRRLYAVSDAGAGDLDRAHGIVGSAALI
jgi:chorismate mutase